MPMQQKESRTVEQYSGQEFTGIGRGSVAAMDVHPPFWNIPFWNIKAIVVVVVVLIFV